MIGAEHRLHSAERLITSAKPATRAELLRRVNWAADFICSNYANPITLDDMAAAASLSKFHLIRLFRQIHSVSPHRFLINKRLAAAGRLLDRVDFDLGEVARLAASARGGRFSGICAEPPAKAGRRCDTPEID